MRFFRRLFHPLITFLGIQLLWLALLIGWIYWFLGRHQQLKDLAERFQTEMLPQKTDWFILVEGILLLVAILIGIYVIFLYWRRQVALYRAQHHFIAQVSHELKSPLASLQLHLDTIEMRQPGPDQLQRFVTLMQDDTERLNHLIANLLTASRLEHQHAQFHLTCADFSAALSAWLERKRVRLSLQERLSWQLEPGIMLYFDAEAMETVVRNLIENAVLYSEGEPQVEVRLWREQGCAHLQITDQGCGIEPKLQRKVFRMFYRGQLTSSHIRGTGLGLFIVRSVIRGHRGKVWLESPGVGKGTTVHLQIPLTEEDA